METTPSLQSKSMQPIQNRLEHWKQRLVDLSRRNKLLFFEPASKSRIKAVNLPPTEIFQRLVIEEKPLKIYLPHEDFEADQAKLQFSATGETKEKTTKLRTNKPGDGELELEFKDAATAQAALRNLFRRSKGDFEERGVRILHLTFGMVNWKESNNSDNVRTPIILVPMQLERTSLRAPYQLRMAEEEVILNPALQIKFKNDWKVELPPLPDDWEEVPLDSYIAKVRRRLERLDWSVSTECWLGLFSFHKLVMYQDLASNSAEIVSHPIVKALGGIVDRETKDALDFEFPEPSKLDLALDPSRHRLIMDADSSQLSCIEAAKQGKSLVIHGPPGTGKSQTITNLIADAISDGKSVLFVSEKMAALDVVYKRLKSNQLGHYCLEIHSQKTNKKEVVQELFQSFQEKLSGGKELERQELQRLLKRRDSLNKYVQELHKIREPLGLSAFQVLGELSKLESTVSISGPKLELEAINPDFLNTLLDIANRLKSVWSTAKEGKFHIWSGCKLKSFSIDSQARLLNKIEIANTSIQNLLSLAENTQKLMGWGSIDTIGEIKKLYKVKALLKENPGVTQDLFHADLSLLLKDLSELQRLSNSLEERLGYLSTKYTQAFIASESSYLDELNGALNRIEPLVKIQLLKDECAIEDLQTVIQWTNSAKDAISIWQELANLCAVEFGISHVNSIENIEEVLGISDYYNSKIRADVQWFSRDGIKRAKTSIETLENYFAKRVSLKAHLDKRYSDEMQSCLPEAAVLKKSLIKLSSLLEIDDATSILDHRKKLLSLLNTAEESLTEITRISTELSEYFGLPRTRSLKEVERLIKLGDLLSEAQQPIRTWFNRENLNKAKEATSCLAEDIGLYQETTQMMLKNYKQNIHSALPDLQEFWRALKLAEDCINLPEVRHPQIWTNAQFLHDIYKGMRIRANSLREDYRLLSDMLELKFEPNSIETVRAVKLAELCMSAHRPNVEWFNQENFRATKLLLARLIEKQKVLRKTREALLEDHETSVFDLDAESYLADLKGKYDSPFAWLKPGFHSIKKRVRNTRRDGIEPKNLLLELNRIKDYRTFESEYRQLIADEGARLLGDWIQGVEIDTESITLAIQVVEETLRLDSAPEKHLIHRLSRNSSPSPEMARLIERLKANLIDWEKLLNRYTSTIPIERLSNSNLPFLDSSFTQVIDWLASQEASLERIVEVRNKLTACLKLGTERSAEQLFGDLKDIQTLNDIEARVSEKSDYFKQALGRYYQGLNTDVDSTLLGLSNCEQLLNIASENLTQFLIQRLEEGSPEQASLARNLKQPVRVYTDCLSKLSAHLQLVPSDKGERLYLAEILERITATTEELEKASKSLSVIEESIRLGEGKLSSIELLRDITIAEELSEVELKGQKLLAEAESALGWWYSGHNTKVLEASEAIEIAEEVVEHFSDFVPAKLAQALSASNSWEIRIAELLAQAKKATEYFIEESQKCHQWLPLEAIPPRRLELKKSTFREIELYVDELRLATQRVLEAFEIARDYVRSPRKISKLNFSTLIMDLTSLEQLRIDEKSFEQESTLVRKFLPLQFAGLNTDWEALERACNWMERLRKELGNKAPTNLFLTNLDSAQDLLHSVEEIDTQCALTEESFETLSAEFEDGWLSHNDEKTDLQTVQLGLIHNRLNQLLRQPEGLRDWTDFKAIEEEFNRRGFRDLLWCLVRQPDMVENDLIPAIKKWVYSSWITNIFEISAELGRFRGQEHEEIISDFRHLERKLIESGPQRVVFGRKKNELAQTLIHPGSEAHVLYREAGKRKKQLSLRRLFNEIPHLLCQLKPCLLMSPISVSQFLDLQSDRFDLVIFDEASQICTEDAIGAIYRGKQVVICGDNKQLPPTSFFERESKEEFTEDETEQQFDVYNSILDECITIGVKQGHLNWHYRSKHEDLIAFSNHQFYGSRLITFPSAQYTAEHANMGIKFICVEDGIYDRGGKCNNIREAEVVADLVVKHFSTQPMKSLGVIAFSSAQADAIMDAIEKLAKTQPELESHISSDRLEGFFVKNLENVQGDERDTIIFSVGYGPDQDRRLTMNFGPLNTDGGERRLNVAVTRAREQITLVSSFRASQMDVGRIQSAGVRSLYYYLDYAERGRNALMTSISKTLGDYDSPLERSVAEEIRRLGYQTVSQVGCSEFRVDLGVIDPAVPGRFILGVECDGATYHSSATARDRDRMRQEILESKGWRIHRIWSPDWVSRRETEIERLKFALEQARKAPPIMTKSKPLDEQPAKVFVRKYEPDLIDEEADFETSWIVPYERTKLRLRIPPGLELAEPEAAKFLSQLITNIVSFEGPVHFKIITKRISDHWGLERMSNRRRSAIEQVLEDLVETEQIYRDGDFFAESKGLTCSQVRQPNLQDLDSYRTIDLIPPTELELAIVHLVEESLSLTDEVLAKRVAKVFGFDRTGGTIKESIDTVISESLSRGVITRIGQRLGPGSPSGA